MLTRTLTPDTVVLLIDDGSDCSQENLAGHLDHPCVHRLRHDASRGPAAARNTGIAWCRERGVDLVVLLDNDCTPQPGFVRGHVALHSEHPDMACIGGGIRGVGSGFWARLDGIASWFTSIPGAPPREITGVYHVPTANMSLKLALMPKGDLFDTRLRTGEDVAFNRRLSAMGARMLFSSAPLVFHHDREKFRAFIAHQYRWAVHTYVVRCGNCHNLAVRLLIAMAFVPLLPAYALAASVVNVRPLLSVSARYMLWWPALFILYALKGVGVIEGIVRPGRALFPVDN